MPSPKPVPQIPREEAEELFETILANPATSFCCTTDHMSYNISGFLLNELEYLCQERIRELREKGVNEIKVWAKDSDVPYVISLNNI